MLQCQWNKHKYTHSVPAQCVCVCERGTDREREREEICKSSSWTTTITSRLHQPIIPQLGVHACTYVHTHTHTHTAACFLVVSGLFEHRIVQEQNWFMYLWKTTSTPGTRKGCTAPQQRLTQLLLVWKMHVWNLRLRLAQSKSVFVYVQPRSSSLLTGPPSTVSWCKGRQEPL